MQIKPKNKIGFATFILSLILCVACTGNDLYNAHTDIPKEGWSQHIQQEYNFTIQQRDTCNISLFIRHDNSYKYRNIWLFVEHISPDSICRTDTINYTLADRYGNWYGGGWGTYHQFQHILYRQIPLDSGTHTIKISQAMRERYLQGISNVGINVAINH